MIVLPVMREIIILHQIRVMVAMLLITIKPIIHHMLLHNSLQPAKIVILKMPGSLQPLITMVSISPFIVGTMRVSGISAAIVMTILETMQFLIA